MKRKQYTSKEKLTMIFEASEYPDGKAEYCRQKGISENLIYKWKQKLLSTPDIIFKPGKKVTSLEKKLKDDLIKKDSIISALAEENILLKKKHGE